MKAELHNRLRNAEVRECTRVLIRDNFNNPICLIVKYLEDNVGREGITIAKLGDKDFHALLRQYGVNDTVVCEKMSDGPPEGSLLI